MTDILAYANLAVGAVIVLLLLRRKPFQPSTYDNYDLPFAKAKVVMEAINSGKPAIFHGGCVGCIWRHQNTTHEGLAFCRGCSYFAFNRARPDKSITDYDIEKGC